MKKLKFSLLALALIPCIAIGSPVRVKANVKFDDASQQLLVTGVNDARIAIPSRPFEVESFCEFIDIARNHTIFIVGDEGRGEQWQIADREGLLDAPAKVRDLALPPTATHCDVDYAAARLYVNEEGVGIWSYPADAEAELVRRPVALEAPYGLFKSIAAFTVAGGNVIVADPKLDAVKVLAPSSKNSWKETASVAVAGLGKIDLEKLDFRNLRNQELQLRAVGDDGELDVVIPWTDTIATRAADRSVNVVAVMPTAQTTSVKHMGDAADDPAIWVHPTDKSRSLVLGTDKKGGLQVFDLQGQLLQDLRVGRLNNVDVRSGRIDGREWHIAAASHRDNESLRLFAIDARTARVRDLADIPTTHKEIYGLCVGKDKTGAMYVIANQKDGLFVQYQLVAAGSDRVSARKVREFRVNSQPEGCVVNDRTGDLYVGEEAKGVYVLPLSPQEPAVLRDVIRVGDVLHKDVEGLGIYNGTNADYLVVSSQGNDSYVILDAQAPFAVRGVVRIMANARSAIDGASETDGLEVTSANLGGAYETGMLVVQDGRKRMPEAPQNFKYVPWAEIAKALNLH